MTARIVSEQHEGLLIVRLKGSVAFDEADFGLRDRLVALIDGHVQGGGTQLLIDYSKTRFIYASSSLPLATLPIVQKSLIGSTRVAACFQANRRTRALFLMTKLDRMIDCFEGEGEALAFLRSGRPMTQGDEPNDHGFWATLGPEVGPDPCGRADCGRLRIALSAFCQRHHYEMVKGTKYERPDA